MIKNKSLAINSTIIYNNFDDNFNLNFNFITTSSKGSSPFFPIWREVVELADTLIG